MFDAATEKPASDGIVEGKLPRLGNTHLVVHLSDLHRPRIGIPGMREGTEPFPPLLKDRLPTSQIEVSIRLTLRERGFFLGSRAAFHHVCHEHDPEEPAGDVHRAINRPRLPKVIRAFDEGSEVRIVFHRHPADDDCEHDVRRRVKKNRTKEPVDAHEHS